MLLATAGDSLSSAPQCPLPPSWTLPLLLPSAHHRLYRRSAAGAVHRGLTDLKELVAELTLEEPLAQKKHERGWERPRLRYLAADKLEIIRLVAGSHLGVKRTLPKLGVSRTTFYRWYDLYARFNEVGLEDRRAGPGRVWNRIPDDVRRALVEMALERPELSPRELAVTFTDERAYFVSEASVYTAPPDRLQPLPGAPS